MKETANVLYPQSCSSFTKDSGKFLRRTSCCCYSNQKVNKRELCRGVKKRITISIIVFSFFPHSDISTFCHQTPTCRRYVNVVFIEIIKKYSLSTSVKQKMYPPLKEIEMKVLNVRFLSAFTPLFFIHYNSKGRKYYSDKKRFC